jgi:hypothetical protein
VPGRPAGGDQKYRRFLLPLLHCPRC